MSPGGGAKGWPYARTPCHVVRRTPNAATPRPPGQCSIETRDAPASARGMRYLNRWVALIGFVLPLAVVAAAPATPEIMEKIYAEYWDEYSAQNPLDATFNGDNRFNDQFGHEATSTWR